MIMILFMFSFIMVCIVRIPVIIVAVVKGADVFLTEGRIHKHESAFIAFGYAERIFIGLNKKFLRYIILSTKGAELQFLTVNPVFSNDIHFTACITQCDIRFDISSKDVRSISP